MSKVKAYSYLIVFLLFCGAVGAAYYFYQKAHKLSASQATSCTKVVKPEKKDCPKLVIKDEAADVTFWAGIAVERMFSWREDDTDMSRYDRLTKPFFMPKAWPQVQKKLKQLYINKSLFPEKVLLNGKSTVTSAGVDKKAKTEAWDVKVPYKLVYSDESSEVGNVALKILQVKPAEGFRGLAINAMCLNGKNCDPTFGQ
jgi:hypothetical protein